MKFLSLFTVVTISCFSSLSHSQQIFDPSGDSEFSISPRIVRVHVEYYEITTLEYAGIMSEENLSTNDTKLRNKVLELAKEGKAKLVEIQTLTSRSGERMTSESISEYIYPTEFEHPYSEVSTKENDTETTKKSSSSPTPTAFETRNVGATLEVEPILGEDGSTVDLILKPEIVSLIGHSDWGTSADGKVPMKMPTFRTYRINTSITVIKGQYHMAAALTPQNENNETDSSKKLLVFVKSDILNVKK